MRQRAAAKLRRDWAFAEVVQKIPSARTADGSAALLDTCAGFCEILQ